MKGRLKELTDFPEVTQLVGWGEHGSPHLQPRHSLMCGGHILSPAPRMEDAGAVSFAYTGKMRPMETANGATLTQQAESRELCQVTCSFLDMNEPAMYPKPAHRESSANSSNDFPTGFQGNANSLAWYSRPLITDPKSTLHTPSSEAKPVS